MTDIDVGWQEWIAENLLMGADKAALLDLMMQSGLNRELAQAELNTAEQHPYIRIGKKFYEVLQRREWRLRTLDTLAQMDQAYLKIAKEHLPMYRKFIRDYYSKNRPGHFVDAIKHWPALKWTPEILKRKIGDAEVEVQYGREKDPRFEENGNKYKRMMKFSAFADEVMAAGATNDFYLTANNTVTSKGALQVLGDDILEFGDGYFTNGKEALLWFGPKGTITPLHHDLTNNIFVQLYGKKRFIMIPSLQVPYMYNDQRAKHVYSLVDGGAPDLQQFPLYKNITPITLEVNAGEALFIPIGWYHYVVSESVSISLTFTNFRDINNYFVQGFSESYSHY